MRLALDAQTATPGSCSSGSPRSSATDARPRASSTRRRTTEPEIAAQRERVDRLREAPRRPSTATARADARQLAGARRRPRPPGRLDHRRRRLGLRHRLRRPRPGPRRPAATSTSSCSTPRSTPTPAARRPRRRRAAPSPSSRRPARAPARRTWARSPAPTATSTWPRSRWAPTTPRPIKALLEAEAWPGPSLVIAYSTCIAHGIDMSQVDEPPEGRRQERLLAAVPLPADARSRTARRSSSTRAQPIDPDRATSSPPRPASRSSQRTHPERAAELAELAQADADERWRYYEQLAGIERTVPHVHAARRRTSEPGVASRDRRPRHDGEGGPRHDRRPAHPLPRASTCARRSSRRRRPLTGDPAHGPARWRRPASAAIVLPSLFEEEILAEEIELNRSLEQGTEQFAEALDYFPAVDGVRRRRRPLPRARSRRSRRRSSVPGHRQPQRRHAPAAGSATPGGSRTPGADALELNLYHVAADPRRTAADRRGRRTSTSIARGPGRRSTIPLAVKLSPYYSALANFARSGRRRRRRRPRPVQPLLPAGPRPRHARRRDRGSS